MEDELINLIKKKGLNFTRRVFKFNDLITSKNENINTEINEKEFERDYVLFSLQKWIREKHNIHIDVSYLDNIYNFYYKITKMESNFEYEVSKSFQTYEKALEEALYEALKMI